MAKPGQGFPHPRLIDKLKLKSPLRYLAEGSITATLWAVWLYWISPVLTLILWFLGIKFFYQTLFADTSVAKLVEFLSTAGIFIFVILSAKLIWIYYNYHFIFKRRGERRLRGRNCSAETVAKFFDADPEIVEEAKRHNRIKVVSENKKLIIMPSPSD